jgi:hypothetical protein
VWQLGPAVGHDEGTALAASSRRAGLVGVGSGGKVEVGGEHRGAKGRAAPGWRHKAEA